MGAEKSIVSEGGTAIFKQTDISRPDDVKELILTTAELFTSMDLINNAGISQFKSPYLITLEEWDEILNTNLPGSISMFKGGRR